MNQLSVSFVIPAHNESDNIQECISAIRNQNSLDKIEIVVVTSSGTMDDTLEKAEASVVPCFQSNHCSRAIQMNQGASITSGDILCFVHADVRLPQNAPALIIDEIKNGNDCGFFSYQFDRPNRWLNINASFTKKDGVFAGGGDQSLFITRSAFDTLGGFDEKIDFMEDFELFERIKAKGLSYTIIKKDATVSARKYENNSYLRVNLTNALVFVLYKIGTHPARLKRIYNRLLTL